MFPKNTFLVATGLSLFAFNARAVCLPSPDSVQDPFEPKFFMMDGDNLRVSLPEYTGCSSGFSGSIGSWARVIGKDLFLSAKNLSGEFTFGVACQREVIVTEWHEAQNEAFPISKTVYDSYVRQFDVCVWKKPAAE